MSEALSEVIKAAAAATQEELTSAARDYPTSGLVEALGFLLGAEREKEIISRIASEMKIGVLSDDEVNLEFSVSGVSFGPLAIKFKAVPLMVAEDSLGIRKVVLGMADPTDESAKLMFSELFSATVMPCIAREKAIADAFKKFSAPKEGQQALSAEIPVWRSAETTKAVQQIVSTAIKHKARGLRLNLAAPFAKVEFFMASGKSTAAEISVDPKAIAAAVLDRSQQISSDLDGPIYSVRYSFRSITADLQVRYNKKKQELLIDKIATDERLQPCFWKAISKACRSRLMRAMDDGSGVLIVASDTQGNLTEALRSISELYPDALILKNKSEILFDNAVYERSANSIVVLPMLEANIFTILSYRSELTTTQRERIRGVFCFAKLPRECVSCSQKITASSVEIAQLPEFLQESASSDLRAKGCDVCQGTGHLGDAWLASALMINKEVGVKFVDGASDADLYRAIAASAFISNAEVGMQLVASGIGRIGSVFKFVKDLPADYINARNSALSYKSLDLQWSDEVLPEPAAEVVLTGGSAFSGRKIYSEDEIVSEKKEFNKVLVIDDDPDQRAIISRVLEIEGYIVESAEDGIDGLVTASKVMPDLIIVDFMMPEMDGTETVRRLKSGKETADIPIIALTAYPDSEIEFSLLDAGADDFCSKSISKKILLKRVARLLS